MAGGLKWDGKRVQRTVEQEAERALDKTAFEIITAARDSMREPKHGWDYSPAQGASRTGRAKRRSSAAGEAPAIQTGKLRSSLAKEKPRPLVRRIGTNLPYGKHLEFGTKNMVARPYLRPAFEKKKKRFEYHMKGKV